MRYQRLRKRRRQALGSGKRDLIAAHARGYATVPSHAVLSLPQRIVHQAALRLMGKRDEVRRDDLAGGDVSAVLANPLIGLSRGDGMVFGTWEKRPRACSDIQQ
jgi:hypothetical protein